LRVVISMFINEQSQSNQYCSWKLPIISILKKKSILMKLKTSYSNCLIGAEIIITNDTNMTESRHILWLTIIPNMKNKSQYKEKRKKDEWMNELINK
jgi:hypothetical protein